jgi:hypothetical protein
VASRPLRPGDGSATLKPNHPHGLRGWSGHPQKPKPIFFSFFFFFLAFWGGRTTPLAQGGSSAIPIRLVWGGRTTPTTKEVVGPPQKGQKKKNLREAVSSDLNGLLSGGRPPKKLLQVGLICLIFKLRFEGFLSCIFSYIFAVLVARLLFDPLDFVADVVYFLG